MRKKFTMLLAALLLGLGATNAQVTKYYKPGERKTTLTAGEKVMFYNTAFNGNEDRTGFLVDNGSNFGHSKQKPSASPIFSEKVGVWTIELAEDNTTYYKVNVKGTNGYVGIGGKTNNGAAQDMYIHQWTEIDASKRAGVKSEQADGTVIENTAITAEDYVWLVANGATANAISNTWNGNASSFATWSTGHPYAIYSVVEATTAELETLLANAKTTAKATLTELATIPLYTVGTAVDAVDAVTMENNDLETALNAIDAIVINVKKTIDGKNVTFQNHGSGERGGRYLGYDKSNSRAAAIVKYDNNTDETIWTIKVGADGMFKLYNFANDLYLGDPNSAAIHAAENEAPSFKFVLSSEASKFVLVCSNGKWVHVANNSNYKLIHHESKTDGASLWTVSEVGTIQITRDNYNAKSTVLNDLMAYAKQLQDEVGLVTGGDKVKVVVNHPSGGDSQPSSNLLDGNNGTFVHSSYDGSTMNTVDNHYIEVELSKATQNIVCYFSKRDNNNRPAVIKVLAGNSAENITTEVATLTMGESYDGNVQSYFSKGIDLGAEYTHLRFVVTKTNTGSKFFTLSEFYVLPIDEETQNISNLTSASITDADINTKVAAAQSYLKGFLFADVYDVLLANENNHAATPALGQYPTATYEALEAAFNDDAATQETLEAAVAEFEKSLNKPVYFITSKHDGYAAGSAIYYDGAWKWGTANIYNKQMWMTIPGYTEENVPAVEAYDAKGTSYAICDYLTGTKMRGKDVQIVKVAGRDGVVNLQYGTATDDAVQHAQDGGALVGWNPASVKGDGTMDCGASAWYVEFIGTSYELAQLTDEFFAAANELAAINVPNFNFAAGVNNYDAATRPALDAAVANRATVLSEFSTANEIAAAKTQLETAIAGVQLNMPENGKFYRLRCTGSGMKYLQYTQNTDANRFDMISGDAGKTANATFCYINGGLVAYANPLYINHDENVASYKTDVTKVTFSEATGVTGQYFINIGGRYMFGDGNKSDSGAGTPDNRAGYRWWLEEVTTIPVTVSDAGYATFFAPVALTVPEGVTAYVGELQNDWLILKSVTTIPANTGVVLQGEGDHVFTVTTTTTTYENNVLSGYVVDTQVADSEVYTLQGDANSNIGVVFRPFDGSKPLDGFKAFIPATTINGANAISIRFEGSTDIENVEIRNEKSEMIFDLLGRRVEAMTKGGIYIVNGKKVVIK